MEASKCCIFILCLAMATTMLSHCADARRSTGIGKSSKQITPNIRNSKKLELMSKIMSLVIDQAKDTLPSNTQPYGLSSPNSLPPFDSLPLSPLPENSPPYCINPPSNPQTPSSSTTPSPPAPSYNIPPVFPGQSPPSPTSGEIPGPSGGGIPSPAGGEVPSPTGGVFPSPSVGVLPSPTGGEIPSPAGGGIPSPSGGEVPSPSGGVLPSPTGGIVPNPPETVPSPPSFEPSPPGIVYPSPTTNIPSPSGSIPSPTVFEPPIVYPPPTTPPPPPTAAPASAAWCVVKPAVPGPIIQEAVNYACASGADCDSIQPNGRCFQPNTIYAHASFAFNSYWQRTKVAGGTCDFGGTAILVTVDPSYDGCRFDYY